MEGDRPKARLVNRDFYGEGRGRMASLSLAPGQADAAESYYELRNGKLKVAKMDVDANTETAPKYGIRGIPTLIVFNNGEKVGEKVGALSKSQLSAFIDSVI